MKEDTYILNPNYLLRNDIEKILLYAGNDLEFSQSNWMSFIHPFHAMILSFFTYERTLEENIRLISCFFEKTEEQIWKWITPFLENDEPFYVEWQDHKIAFPKKVLIKKDPNKNDIPRRKYDVKDFLSPSVNMGSKRPLRAPLFFTLMLNNRCVTKCVYCYADKQKKDYQTLTTERILEIIEEARSLQMQRVDIIGGEVFLHKDWPIILKTLVDATLSPEIISTKMPITEDLLGKLDDTGYKNPIQISLDSIDPVILEKNLQIHDGEDYLSRIKQGLKLIDQSGKRYQVATILTNQNDRYEIMEQLYAFLKTLKHIESWRISPAWNSLYVDKIKFGQIKSTKKSLEELYDKIESGFKAETSFDIQLSYFDLEKEYYNVEGGSKTFQGRRCTALQRQMFVLPDGKVTICEQLYWKPRYIIGDLRNSSIEEVWRSGRVQELLTLKQSAINKKSACHSCKLYDDCFTHRCWTDVIKAYGDENWDFPDPQCKKAPEMICDIGFS